MHTLSKMTATVIVCFLLFACNSNNLIHMGIDSEIESKRFKLIEVDGEIFTPTDNNNPPFIAFSEELTISGSDGCNRFFGQSSINKNRLSVSGFGMTKMYCADQPIALESVLIGTLNQQPKIHVSDELLTVSGEDHQLVFEQY